VTNYETVLCDTIEEVVEEIEKIATTTPIQVVSLPYWAPHRRKNAYKYLLVQGA
jgi:hypothetical protein